MADGFRSLFRDWADEETDRAREVIEAALAHVVQNKVEVGYVGSRSHRLLNQRYTNRARPVDGIRQITRTINLRRPDPRYFDVLHVVNGSIGYFDAAKATFRVSNRAGLNLDAT